MLAANQVATRKTGDLRSLVGADWLERLEDTLLRLGDRDFDAGFWNRHDLRAANLDVGGLACGVSLGSGHCRLAKATEPDCDCYSGKCAQQASAAQQWGAWRGVVFFTGGGATKGFARHASSIKRNSTCRVKEKVPVRKNPGTNLST